MLDIEPCFMNIDKSTNYELRVEHLEKEKISALQISSPSKLEILNI